MIYLINVDLGGCLNIRKGLEFIIVKSIILISHSPSNGKKYWVLENDGASECYTGR